MPAISGTPEPGAVASAGERSAAEQFERIRRDPPALRAFLRAFPKGADLDPPTETTEP